MFDLKATIIDETKSVADAAQKAGYKNMGHAAASIRKMAIVSIEKSDKPSEPGTPPHTRGNRKGFKRGILYAVEKIDGTDFGAVIGTSFSKVGPSGEPHEHGGKRGKNVYEPRPFMAPALGQAAPRLGQEWAGTIGN